MNTRKKLALIFGFPLFIALVVAVFYYEKVKEEFKPTMTPTSLEEKIGLIRVTSPLPGDVVISPLIIKGEARGYWFFEGDFPAILYDGDGHRVIAIPVQAQENWMTENFVPFYGKMNFEPPKTASGVLILQKDNPSGLPELDDEIQIPIKFK